MTSRKGPRVDTISLQPSRLVQRFAVKIAEAAGSKPVLDVACGSGRNALALARLGCAVICVDRDLAILKAHRAKLRTDPRQGRLRLTLREMDLLKDPWPFPPHAAGGIVSVHFLCPALLPLFETSVAPGSYLLIETVPGHGGNYLELPKVGEIWAALHQTFEFESYQERQVGPAEYRAATVRALAKRRAISP